MTNPPAACADSHSRTYRSVVFVFAASSADVIGPAPAIALYSPSLSPTMMSAAFIAAPISPTAFIMNSRSFASLTGRGADADMVSSCWNESWDEA